jgi:Rap1a immunity proteins
MPARAERANIMLAKCMGALGDAGMWHCIGIVEGIAYTGNFAKLFCSPPDMELHYIAIAVKVYIEARPQRMHEDFVPLAIEALTAAWPCKR